jgi:hypothetical protein
MSERGVFAVDRGIWDHPMFADEPFTEREAWSWLIGEASFKARARNIGGKIVQLERGQLAASVRFMAERWKWSKSRVDRFLKRLKTTARKMIGTSLKAARDDAQAVLGAIQRARDHRPHEPIPWITNSLKGPTNERPGSVYANPRSEQSGSTAVLAGVAAAAERRARERIAAGRSRPDHAAINAAAVDDFDFFGASRS